MPKITKTNVDLEVEGRWVEYGQPDDDGKVIELKIARMGNPKYEARLAKLKGADAKRIRAMATQGGDLDLSIFEPKVKEACAHHILVGWRNLEDDDGNEIPYSPEAALAIFNDPAYHDFYSFVKSEAGDSAAYVEEVAEDSRGNSQPS